MALKSATMNLLPELGTNAVRISLTAPPAPSRRAYPAPHNRQCVPEREAQIRQVVLCGLCNCVRMSCPCGHDLFDWPVKLNIPRQRLRRRRFPSPDTFSHCFRQRCRSESTSPSGAGAVLSSSWTAFLPSVCPFPDRCPRATVSFAVQSLALQLGHFPHVMSRSHDWLSEMAIFRPYAPSQHLQECHGRCCR